MLSAFQVKVRSSNLTLRGIVKSSLKKKTKKTHKGQAERLQKAYAYYMSFIEFCFWKKKIDFNAWNVFWSGSTRKKLTLF